MRFYVTNNWGGRTFFASLSELRFLGIEDTLGRLKVGESFALDSINGKKLEHHETYTRTR